MEQRPWILTQVEDEGEFSRHLHYRLSNGTRKRVTITTAVDTEELRKQIGDGLESGRVGIGRGRK